MNVSYSSDTKQILCQGYLAQLNGAKGWVKGCQGSNNCDPSLSDGDSSGVIYTVSDNIGVFGTCKDYFPTWGEREMFYRDSSNPVTMKLHVLRNYCWGRNFFYSSDNCGGPNWGPDWWSGLSWDYGTDYASWDNPTDVVFSLPDDIGSDKAKTIFWGSNYAYIDYEQQDGIPNKKRVCAYYSPSWIASGFTGGTQKIGCIDIPLMPAPPIYNKIIVPTFSVAIASDIPNSSTFENPAITLKVINSGGNDTGETITLTYDFTQDNNQQVAQSLLGQSFYPIFSADSNPSKICASSDKGVLGCIDRKKPSDSGIKIEAVAGVYTDNDCNAHGSGATNTFRTLKIKLTKADGTSVTYPQNDIGIREYYACTKKVPDPTSNTTRDVTTSGSDTINILGVKFSAVIPEFTQDSKNFKMAYIYPPTLQSPQVSDQSDSNDPAFQNSCSACFVEAKINQQNNQEGQGYIVPAGKRDRSSCQQKYKCKTWQSDPSVTDPNVGFQQCTFGYNNQYNPQEQAYCRGVYIGQQDANTNVTPSSPPNGAETPVTPVVSTTSVDAPLTPDKICIKLESSWKDFFGKDDVICADMQQYTKLTKDDISYNTGFVDFSNDGYDPAKTYPVGSKLPGTCDASLGLQNSTWLDANFDLSGNSYSNASDTTDFITNYVALNNALSSVNGGVAPPTASLVSALISTPAQSPPDLTSIIKMLNPQITNGSLDELVSQISPFRTLDGNAPIGEIHDACKFPSGESGCADTTDPADFLGNGHYALGSSLIIGATLPLPSDQTQPNNQPPIASYTDKDTKMSVIDMPVAGQCANGFSSGKSPPYRICRIITNKDSKIISKTWTDSKVINPCIKQ